MNNFPFSDSPLPRRRLRRVSPAVVLAAFGVGIWIGGFILIFIPAIFHK